MAPKPIGKKRGEIGGEVISVRVYLNNELIYYRDGSLNELQGNTRKYRTDNGQTVNLSQNQDYLDLANKLLNDVG